MSSIFEVPDPHACDWEGQLRVALLHQLEVERSIAELVEHGRSEHSVSWATIAGHLGVTRQAARQRFSRD